MEEIKQFGHYQVHSELGRGGMAIVYKCWEESLQRYVAIKVLTPHLAEKEDIKERFFREAKSMAAISHPNVINVHFIGEEKGAPYFAMEYIEGQSLSELLQGNRTLDVEHAKNILAQACEGLHAAHENGMIHRDIKPGNIMLSESGFLKLMDFGIAQSNKFDTTLTQTGEIVGTPGYLSPEICIGETVDKRSDIYSLGVVFYQMLAGDVPFDTSTPYKLLKDIVESDISNVQDVNNKVDDQTAAILLKMIEKNPEDRYQSCREVLDDLGKVEKNTELQTILDKSKVNTHALEKTTMSFQLTEIRQTGSSSNKKSFNIKPLIAAVAAVLVVLLGGYYFANSEPQNEDFDPFVAVSSDQTQQQAMTSEAEFERDKDSDSGQNELTQPLASTQQSCLEIGEVSFLDQSSKKWSLSRNDIPDEDLLTLIRTELTDRMSGDQDVLDQWSQVSEICPESSHLSRLTLMITSYKKDTKKKLISKMGLGKEKISMILTLTDQATNSILANKEIETKDISLQLSDEIDDSEFVDMVKDFVAKS